MAIMFDLIVWLGHIWDVPRGSCDTAFSNEAKCSDKLTHTGFVVYLGERKPNQKKKSGGSPTCNKDFTAIWLKNCQVQC